MLFDVFVEFDSGIILGIATQDFFVFVGFVRKVDEVTDHCFESFFVKQAMHHGHQRVDAVFFDRFVPGHFSPSIKEFVGRKKGPHFGIDPVADHADGIVFE